MFVIVLGMHRSGTSCLAGCLERSGVFLGEVSRANRHNAKGNHESPEIARVQEAILRASGGRWFAPPRRLEVGWWHRRVLAQHAAALQRENVTSGFKDPRTVLLLDAWLEAVVDPVLIGTFRHPAAVARSLQARGGMSAEQALGLWRHYNDALVEAHRHHGFPVVEYDLADPDRYCRDVAAAAGAIGLEPDVRALREFVDERLQHAAGEGVSVPPTCAPTHGYLRAHRVTT